MIETNQIWARIFAFDGQIFSITFRRKNAKYGHDNRGRRVVLEPAGSERRMLCRRRVPRYWRNVIPEAVRMDEDVTNNVLTVFDLGVFHRLRGQGVAKIRAGRASYRRINMSAVEVTSLPEVIEMRE